MTKGPVLLLLLCFTLLSFPGCKKGGCNVVPYVPFERSVSLVKYNELLLPMQPVELGPESGGLAGLIVMQIRNGEYVAFDRSSTVDPDRQCAVKLVEGAPVAEDPCSGAKYILIDGSPAGNDDPSAAIAECPLKPYYVRRQGDILIVSS